MATLDEMFPGKWLKAESDDVPLAGVVATIKCVVKETLIDGEKWVVYFDELPKALILNVTNAKTVAKLYGKDTTRWGGKKIVLFKTTVPFGADIVDAIRVRSADPQAEAQTALPLP